MAHYLFIESRDPYESVDTASWWDLLRGVKARGNEATLFLVQNGVLPTRAGARHAEALRDVAQRGITVLADEFSLRERAIDRLVDGVRPAGIGALVQLLRTRGVKALWH